MAAKGALAAALAYWIAPHVPGVAAEYPYYAPLGAVLALWPTVKTSLKQGLQTILGLVIGVLLATTVFALQEGQPGVLAVALVVGLGTLIAGIRWLGAGRDWVLTAGLFVLLLGGANAGDYSTGYVVQIGVGVAVGVLVNLLLVPPLYTGRAEQRLRLVQASLADRADDVASVFEADWPIEDDDWERRVAVLPSTLRLLASLAVARRPAGCCADAISAPSTPTSSSSSGWGSTCRTSPRSPASSAAGSAARSASSTTSPPSSPVPSAASER
jgi:uncharacterized membrane protein YgaE (UPF0421/DUF939 family)